MLMQMIPSADAIGQSESIASKATGVRTFVTPVAFTHAAMLRRASVGGRDLRMRGTFDHRGHLNRLRMNAALGGTGEQAIGDQREQ
jgi:hypothetical protein